MCYPLTCPRCAKTTWGGCGEHVDSVMATVPAAQQCTCAPAPAPQTGTGHLAALLRR